jgi:hypothetical protein
MTPASSSPKTAKHSPSSKTKKNQPKLKIVPIYPPYAQEDILKQLKDLKALAKAGTIASLVIYCEKKDGNYFLHTTPSEDTVKTAANLMQMAFVRMGMHK